jgi:hypothetical protein
MQDRKKLQNKRRLLERRLAAVEQKIDRITDEARQAVLSGPPSLVADCADRLRRRDGELKVLEADKAATPEVLEAKRKEVDEAKKTLIFVQETVLSLLPKSVSAPERRRGKTQT